MVEELMEVVEEEAVVIVEQQTVIFFLSIEQIFTTLLTIGGG